MTYWRQKISNCVCWFVSFVKVMRESMHNKTLCCFFFFFLSLSIYSATHFAYIIIHLYVYPHMLLPLLTKDDLISLTFTHSKRIFIYIAHITNDVVVNVYFFSALLLFSLSLLCMSILTCSDSYKREEEIQQAITARG